MDEVNRRLADRRRALASKSRLTLDYSEAATLTMTDFNSKVDLRPPWMIEDDDIPNGKPHVDSVLQPSQREIGIPRSIPKLSPGQLKNVNLRQTGKRQAIDDEGKRSIEDSSNNVNACTLQPKSESSESLTLTIHRPNSKKVTTKESIPPPPPPPQHVPRIGRLTSDGYRQKDQPEFKPRDLSPIKRDNNDEITQLKAKLESMHKLISSTTQGSDVVKERAVNTVLPRPIPERMIEADIAVKQSKSIMRKKLHDSHSPTFDEKELLHNPNMQKWIQQLVDDKFERASRVDNPDIKNGKSNTRNRSKSRSRSRQRGRTKKRSQSRAGSLKSFRSAKTANSNGSIRSVAKSIKSVLFKRTEEEELHSEISDEDVADIQAGETDFIDRTSQRFTIHGPFVDKELNVFHAICSEYQLAARMSFAKRTPFSRTNPAHERVYALLGSDRRSSWTNRNSWTSATNDLQVLDSLFRITIRSRTQRIRKPVMELEHFTEGDRLDSARFYRIMQSIFRKREYLARTLGIYLDKFHDIK